ncbi:hypothetical protein A4H97_11595 [Niastella yeongjuensis]|uniref:histidine kinase n=1 Tax=Niastella yeongjuensis TaxID=354355 RepID=A0A1V9E9I7_9BACT|nr:ATP-binding protein [Niastella yeongjuensis]OQP42798.1 hypothetical protein A4H97_11595 [Niastella yeongjuensis]SEO54436.1 PAS domain S-box-containing protein [Niastella yeongjuensis]
MVTTIKTKLFIGLVFLFIVIICFGVLGIFYVKRLSSDAGMILKDNHISVEFCNYMFKALNELPGDTTQLAIFDKNLRLQEHNITEPGEFEATADVRALFDELRKDPAAFTAYKELRKDIFKVIDVNQAAIIHKNLIAANTASQATLWLTIIVSILSLAAFAFILNFPSVLSRPIHLLTEGIQEIAKKNYSKRIHLDQKNEFGILANTFNAMAQKLDEYEHSNLAEIRLEKSRIEAIINKMNNGIIGLNEKRQILFFNSEAEKLFGLKEKDITGKYASDIALQNDLLRTVLQSGEKKTLKIYLDNKEGYFEQESIVIQTDNGVGGQVIMLKNITPFKELDAAKTNFIATISHELKTPLFAIKMSTQLLDDKRIGELNTDQREILESLKKNTERLLKITGELLNLSQVESGRIQLQKEATQPAMIVERALQAVQQLAAQSQVQLKQNVGTNLPAINIDEEKTTWVLINLLSNAIKYSSENGSVEIKAEKINNQLIFSVADRGKGIHAQYVTHVFDKYFKVPGSNESTSTGLGLSISKEFIEAQGGSIWVKSEYGSGSTFGFNFLLNS